MQHIQTEPLPGFILCGKDLMQQGISGVWIGTELSRSLPRHLAEVAAEILNGMEPGGGCGFRQRNSPEKQILRNSETQLIQIVNGRLPRLLPEKSGKTAWGKLNHIRQLIDSDRLLIMLQHKRKNAG